MITARSSIPPTVKVAISDDAAPFVRAFHRARQTGGCDRPRPSNLVEADAVRGRHPHLGPRLGTAPRNAAGPLGRRGGGVDGRWVHRRRDATTGLGSVTAARGER